MKQEQTQKEIDLNLNERLRRIEIGLLLLIIGAVCIIVRVFMR